MRFKLFVLIALFACLPSPAISAAGTSPNPPVQFLFVGDRDCGDNTSDCVYPGVLPQHRYLHIVLHDVPRSYDWAATESETCAGPPSILVANAVLNADGYLEVAVDLQSVAPGSQNTADCFVFRGREGYPETFYAAYFDDTADPDADTVLPGYKSLGGRPDLADLDVTLIHRDPTYRYDARKNLPAPGDSVTWVADVRNAGTQPSGAFSYQWTLNGGQVGAGQFVNPLSQGQSVQLKLQRRWSSAPDTLSFEITPTGPDASDANNRLSVRTDALSLGIWVEQSAYDYFSQYQWVYCRSLKCVGSNSFDDWIQRQVSVWNALLASSVYPGIAPTGAADRIRLDEMTITPNGSLPLHGGAVTNTPDLADHTVDLEWGIPFQGIADQFRLHRDAEFDIDWSLVHELNHARSLADLYRFDVPERNDQSIQGSALDGAPIVDPTNPAAKLKPYSLPGGQLFFYRNREQDLMSCVCTPTYSAYSILVLNRLRDRRARCGNVNEPCNLGDWYRDLPPRIQLRVVDDGGRPVPDESTIRLFFDSGTSYSGHAFSASNVDVLSTRNGVVALPGNPFHTGTSNYLAGHNLLLIEVSAGLVDTLCFLEPVPFNFAYWDGYRTARQTAQFVLHFGKNLDNACRVDNPPPLLNEPFGASPFTSFGVFAPRPARASVHRVINVTLRDDQEPPLPLYGRVISVRNSIGTSVGRGLTDRRGYISISIPAHVQGLHLVDTTDNNLPITLRRSAPWAQAVH